MSSRKKSAAFSFCVAIVLCLVVAEPEPLHAESWKAGVARVNITPPQFMWMAGYAHRTKPADSTHAELWARVLVLEDSSGKRGALVSMDLIGIDRRLSHAICSQLEKRCALGRAQVALCCSHTHTGPVVGKCLEPLHYRQLDDTQRQLVDQYENHLASRLVQCVETAIKNIEPCRLAWGSGFATFAVNRRNNREGDIAKLRTSGDLTGPVDHDVPVLTVRGDEGKLLAIVFGYACHATVLSDYGWSGDYPGFAAAELESRYEGCVALFWAGCGADQNPLPRRELELAEKYGRQLAESVAAVLEGVMDPIESSLEVSYKEIPLALDKLPDESGLKQAATSDNKYVRARAEMLLEQLAGEHRLSQTYPYPVATWKLGNQIDFVFLGGEVVIDFAIRLKKERQGRCTWVAGYANDVMAYIPSERVLREGGYEGVGAMVYYGLPTAWAPGVEQAIIDAVSR